MANNALRPWLLGSALSAALGVFPACSSSEASNDPAGTAGSPQAGGSGAGTSSSGGTAGGSTGLIAGNSGGGAPAGDAGTSTNGGDAGAMNAGGTAGTTTLPNGGAGGAPLVMGNLTFTRQTLHTFNYAEGIGIADFNNDGSADVVSGPFWWAGPTFEVQHQYFPPPPDNEYTGMSLGDWADYPYDVDGDGWADSITVMRPSTPSYWYKNPGPTGIDAEISAWEKHEIGTLVLEQSMFTDISGEGTPDLVCAVDGQFGWFDVSPTWTFNPIGVSGATNAYAWWHGIGVGDLDGDLAPDLLTDSAWFTRPEGDPRAGAWTSHEQPFDGGNIVIAEHGPSHMYGYDVDDDGDEDVITALNSHGYGVAWFENDAGVFTEHVIVGDANSMATNAGMIAPFSQPHALVVADIDGDGVKDLITGKTFYAHPPGVGDPDAEGAPVFYVFKLIRDETGVTWEPHLVDSEVGLGRQFTTGDLNNDGKVDIAIASKHGVFLFFQE
ncbi:MAG TPA: VCBS repeat-containing protein [Polyangiaceae bacterium]|nr:VCBS repeat-containing protein [Polyangiaceae bacterium]